MKAPIAIITVTYSPGEHLTAFLDSVTASTKDGAIVVMADNGSVDGAPEKAAEEYPWAEFLPTGANMGYGRAINFAARALAGRRKAGEINDEFFVVANPDVVFEPGSIDEMIRCAGRWRRSGAVGPFIRQLDGSPYPSARNVPTLANGIGHAVFSVIWPGNPWSRAYRHAEDMEFERPAGWLSGSCLLLRWDAFDDIDGFDENYFMYMEDVDLGDRLDKAGWHNIFCPTAIITHDQGHVAGEVPQLMLPVHHRSAYRFQADRHPKLWQAPIRAFLWIGLKLRSELAVKCSKMRSVSKKR